MNEMFWTDCGFHKGIVFYLAWAMLVLLKSCFLNVRFHNTDTPMIHNKETVCSCGLKNALSYLLSLIYFSVNSTLHTICEVTVESASAALQPSGFMSGFRATVLPFCSVSDFPEISNTPGIPIAKLLSQICAYGNR